MPQVQPAPKTIPLEYDKAYLVVVGGKHRMLIKPQGGAEPKLILPPTCDGEVLSSPFHVIGFCDPGDAKVTARLVQGTTVINGTPSPQTGAAFDFLFDMVPPGTYNLIVDGCEPPDGCEVTVQ